MPEINNEEHPPTYSAAEIGALAHLYRGEMYRSTVWRTRLDTTSNWAVVTTGIALSVTFSNIAATPLPIVLISFLLTAFLLFEARRYQYFDIWNLRLRVMESCFYDPLLRKGTVTVENDWHEVLAEEIKGLRFHVRLLDAFGYRLRRNYGWIFAIQVISYWSKIAVHPTPLELARRAVGPDRGRPGSGPDGADDRRVLLYHPDRHRRDDLSRRYDRQVRPVAGRRNGSCPRAGRRRALLTGVRRQCVVICRQTSLSLVNSPVSRRRAVAILSSRCRHAVVILSSSCRHSCPRRPSARDRSIRTNIEHARSPA